MGASLRDRIEAIIETIADGSTLYWTNEDDQHTGAMSLDIDAVVNDILVVVVDCNGEEALEVFGGG